MHQLSRSVSLPVALVFIAYGCLAIPGFAQENVVRVGVAILQNRAGRSVPGNVERDRLVQTLNHMKPDKKTHIQVQGVALDAMTFDEAYGEAQTKQCAYVVLTTLTELRDAGDPYQHVPGTIETNPNSQWSSPGNPRAQHLDPEYRVTVEYKLYRVGDPSLVAGAPFSTQAATNEIDAVSQVMDRIATRVADEIKKSTPPMRE
jgi:hypothetical protein